MFRSTLPRPWCSVLSFGMPNCTRPQGSVVLGRYFENASATGFRADAGTRLSTNGARSAICRPPLHAGEAKVVKSPASICAVGTQRMTVGGLLFSMRPWKPPKKNALFFTSGPPRAPPN